jgi:hypothetical protein
MHNSPPTPKAQPRFAYLKGGLNNSHNEQEVAHSDCPHRAGKCVERANRKPVVPPRFIANTELVPSLQSPARAGQFEGRCVH